MAEHQLIEGILAEARSEAEAIIEHARIEADAQKQRLLEEAASYLPKKETEVAQLTQSMRHSYASSIEMERKRLELEHMSEIHTRVLAEVEKQFYAMRTSERYRGYLLNWIVEGLIGLGQSSALVQVSKDDPVDDDLLREAEAKAAEILGTPVSLKLDSQFDPFSLGVTVSSLDGGVAYNNRLNTRMRRLRSNIHRMIYQYEGKHTR